MVVSLCSHLMDQSISPPAAQTSHLSPQSAAAARLAASRALTIFSPGGGEPLEQIRDIRPPWSPKRVSYDEDKKNCFIAVRRKKDAS